MAASQGFRAYRCGPRLARVLTALLGLPGPVSRRRPVLGQSRPGGLHLERVPDPASERDAFLGELTRQLDDARARNQRLRAELDLEKRYSRGLRDTLRRIGALDPVTRETVQEITRDGVANALALALEARRLDGDVPRGA